MKKILLILLLSGVLISCTGTPSIGVGTGFMGLKTGLSFSNLGFSKKEEINLIDGNWNLEKYQFNGKLKVVEKNSKINIIFEKEKVYGNGGVNGFFGNYKVEGNTFEEFGPFGRTMMAGEEILMKQEDDFMKLLEKSNTYKIENNKLYIMNLNELLLVFQNVK